MCESALDVLSRIRRNSRERDYCLAVLELWAQAQTQGIDPETVEAFGFDPKLLAGKDRQAYYTTAYPGSVVGGPFVQKRENGSYHTLMHNYVRLKDGTVTQLSPMLKAVHHYDDND